MTKFNDLHAELVVIILTGLLLLLSACTPIVAPAAGDATEALTPIKAVVLPYISSGPLFIAQEEGFFTEQGLAVEFVHMDTGSGPLPALAQGEIDVAASGPTAGLFNAVANDAHIRIVADKGNFDPNGCTFVALLAPPDWVAANPSADEAALAGLRVSADPTNFEGFMLTNLLSGRGLTLDDVNLQDIAPPALAEAAQNQAVDLISVGEPWVTRLLDTGAVTIWQPAQALAPHLQFGVILFGKKLIEGDPAIGVRFMTAYLQAVRQYNEGQTDRNVEIMAKYTKLDADLLRRACWPAMATDGMVNLDSLIAFQAWSVSSGLVDKPVAVEQLWDALFVTKAGQQVAEANP